MIKTNKSTSRELLKKVRVPKEVMLNREDVPKDAIDKYFIANTAEIFVPDKVVSIGKKGQIKLVNTLNKNKSFRKIKGQPVIKIEDKNINGIVINQDGEKLMDKRRSLLGDIVKKIKEKESIVKRRNYQKQYMKQYRSKDKA
jgi:hypothetical protein